MPPGEIIEKFKVESQKHLKEIDVKRKGWTFIISELGNQNNPHFVCCLGLDSQEAKYELFEYQIQTIFEVLHKNKFQIQAVSYDAEPTQKRVMNNVVKQPEIIDQHGNIILVLDFVHSLKNTFNHLIKNERIPATGDRSTTTLDLAEMWRRSGRSLSSVDKMNPRHAVRFFRDMVAGSEIKNDVLTAFSTLVLILMDNFVLDGLTTHSQKTMLMIVEEVITNLIETKTVPGTGRKFEKIVPKETIDNLLSVTRSALKYIELLNLPVTEQTNLKPLTSEMVEHFFACCNSNDRYKAKVDENNLLKAAAMYDFCVPDSEYTLINSRYRNFYKKSPVYRFMNWKEFVDGLNKSLDGIDSIELMKANASEYLKIFRIKQRENSQVEENNNIGKIHDFYFNSYGQFDTQINLNENTDDRYKTQQLTHYLAGVSAQYLTKVSRSGRDVVPHTVLSTDGLNVVEEEEHENESDSMVTVKVGELHWFVDGKYLIQISVEFIRSSKTICQTPPTVIFKKNISNFFIFYRVQKL